MVGMWEDDVKDLSNSSRRGVTEGVEEQRVDAAVSWREVRKIRDGAIAEISHH